MKRLRLLVVLAVALVGLSILAAGCGDDDASTAVDDGGGVVETDPDPDPGDTPVDPDEPVAEPDEGEVQLGGELDVAINAEQAVSYFLPDSSWLPGGGLLPNRTMYETFTRLTDSGEVIMELADSLEPVSEDFMTWRMTLKPGITFHDGTPLDAQSVVDMRQLWRESKNYAPVGIDTATAIDELTVEFGLFTPDPNLGSLLAGPQGAAFSPTAGLADNTSAVGTGPFMFDDWQRDSRFRVVKNPNYWREDAQPRLDSIVFHIFLDNDVRQAALRAGDVDVVSDYGFVNLRALADDGFILHTKAADTRTTLLNVLIPPLDDVRIRRALAHAINPEDMLALANVPPEGDFIFRHQLYPPDSPWHDPVAEAAYPEYDVDKAKALIDEYVNDPTRSDGKAVGERVSFDYNCTTEPVLFLYAQLYQASWADIGVDVEIKQVEVATYLTDLVGGPDSDPPWVGTNQAGCASESGVGDPLLNYKNSYSDPTVQVSNLGNYTSPEIQAQIAILASTADETQRKAAVAAIEQELNEQVPRHYGAPSASAVILSPKVKGYHDWTYVAGNPADEVYPGADMFWPAIWIDEG